MLSIYSSTSAGQAASYYSQGDYYSQESDGELQAFFSGELANTLGIAREFDKDTFARLLSGKVNDDTQVGRLNKGKVEHRPGWDLTFSAPKSVSVMALTQGGDTRLIEAHRQAVAATMKHIEENLGFIRKGVKGQQQLKKIDGLLYATFEHGTSRLLDMQLHSHNFVMNIGALAGEFRSLETKPIFDNMLNMGLFYRNELAAHSHRLGYELDTSKQGYFELACVPDAVIKQFSKRREEIEAAADERGLHGGKAMQQAALMTRENKLHADTKTCQAQWATELDDLGFTPEHHIPSDVGLAAWVKGDVCADLMISIDHFSQFEAAFKQENVLTFTRTHTLGEYTHDELIAGLNKLKTQGVIFDSSLTSTKGQAHYIVTHKALQIEKATLAAHHAGVGGFESIYNARQVQSHVALIADNAKRNGLGDGFTQGQAAAFTLALSSKDQFIGVNGRAGSGKTYMQKELKSMLEGAGYTVRGMAPTGEAAQKLEAESGIKSCTIDSFLFQREQKEKNKGNEQPVKGFKLKSKLAKTQQLAKSKQKEQASMKKQFWVVDEASLANATHFHDVMLAAREDGARVLFQGDTKQLGAVEWGNALELLIQQGLATAEMTEVMRQKTDEGRAAVKATLDHQYNRALNHLHDNVKTQASAKDMINDWKKLSKDERDSSLIIIPDIATRDKASLDIHAFKALQGEIGHQDVDVHTLVNSRFSDAQKGYGRFYGVGHVVEFQRDVKTLDIKAGERFVVVGKSANHDELHMVNMRDVPANLMHNPALLAAHNFKQDAIKWQPDAVAGKAKRGVEVFKSEKRPFSKNEAFRWTKTDKLNRNGERGKITHINHVTGDVTLTFEKGNERTFNINSPEAHTLDYSYVKTAFVSQGLDAKRVFMLTEFHRRNLVTQKSFYVKLTRMKEFAHIYTNGTKSDLASALGRNLGEKESAFNHANARSLQRDPLSSSFVKDIAKNASIKQAVHVKQQEKEPVSEKGVSKTTVEKAHDKQSLQAVQQAVKQNQRASRDQDRGR